ncbi:hypothetical protein OS493_016906 [Desmophyllum pertusum]|uniref:CCHC-type domain-containing protein n=1 Tax=Desmophyllum pertusum TaxID=174260 RepID=A0A9W9YNN8_9CNID|nr:hypothetical protein OS493_016906 [Desmophyllum pertusum]
MVFKKTVNIQIGRKLSGKSRDEILAEVLNTFRTLNVVAVQQGFEVIRVTFTDEVSAGRVLQCDNVKLFGISCRIQDSGPLPTMIHLFDYPFEASDNCIKGYFNCFGEVKSIRCQKYLTNQSVFTGTRLISMVMKRAPNRTVTIDNIICRTWYKGQPIECNICGMEGHMSRSCPNMDKCRLCGQHGHFARACTTPWNRAPSVPAPVDPVGTDEAVSEAQTSAETPLTARSSVIMEAVSGEPIEEEEIFQDASEHSDSIEEFTSSASDAPSQASQSILRELPPTRAHEPPLAEEPPSVLVVSQSAPAFLQFSSSNFSTFQQSFSKT